MSTPEAANRVGEALAKIPSGVSILTAHYGAQATGMLASWIQQACFEPPMISICVKHHRPILELIAKSQSFCLNVLGEDPGPLFRHFGPGFNLEDEAFRDLAIERDDCGIVLTDAIAVLACRVAGGMDAGDHHLMLGEVLRARVLQTGSPYIHIRKTGFSY